MKTNYLFENENNYVFDSNKIEIVSQDAQLVAIVSGAEAYAYWTMDDNVEDDVFRDLSGNSRDLALKGGLIGGTNKVPAKIGNGLVGISTTQGFCSGGTEDFNFEYTDSFSLEFWIKTSSSETMSIVAKQNDVPPFDGYGATVLGGKVRGIIRDALGNIISKENDTIINDDTFHHIVMTYDGTGLLSGLRIFVDNTENDNIIANTPIAGSIINTINFQISGRNGNTNCIDSDTIVDEVVVYSRELTEAEITFRWNNGDGTQQLPGATTSFPTDNPSIQSFFEIQSTKLKGVLVNIDKSGLDEVRGVLVVNGIDTYWNGSSWEVSSGYIESNTIADLNSNAETLISQLASINLKLFLHSADGSTTPKILDYTLDFDKEQSSITLTENTVFGYIYSLNSEIPNKIMHVQTFDYVYGSQTIITSDPIPVTINPDGSFLAKLYIENALPSGLIWTITDVYNIYNQKIIRTNFLTGSRLFGDLTILD